MRNIKGLIIYFSRADENYFGGEKKYIEKGNTEVIAEYIKEITDSDIFKVEPLNPYSEKYSDALEEAKMRTKNHNAPIKESVPDISSYEVIYVGSPVYFENMPQELVTALKDLDFKGKTIRPFITHEGSGLGSIPSELSKLCKDAVVTDALAIIGSKVNDSKKIVESWINI